MKEIWDQFKDMGREEGIVEGRSQGIVEGRTQGIAEGRTQGIAEGRTLGKAEGLLQAARDLMEGLQCTTSRALELLKIPPEEQGEFLRRL